MLHDDRLPFLLALILLNLLFCTFHALRTRITLGAFFGAAGVFGLMLWQVLHTGWWVDMGRLHFNAGLTLFIPILLWGALLSLALDGLKTARAFILTTLITGLAAWGFAFFREQLARYVPLPYIIELGHRDHLSILASLILAQHLGLILLNSLRPRLGWLALPLALPLSSQLWLLAYSLMRYDFASSLNNLRNESLEFLLATLPALLLSLPYLYLAQRQQRLMPSQPLTALLRPGKYEDGRDELTNRSRTIGELQQLNQQLQEHTRLIDYHIDHANYGILLTDAQHRIRRANQAARQLLQLTAPPIGQALPPLLSQHLGPIPPLAELASNPQPLRCKLQRPSSGPPTWIELRVTPLIDRHKHQAHHILLQDISASVQAEQRRLNSARIKDIHTTGRVLAHDFSNILIGARAQLEKLRQHPADPEAIAGIDAALQHAQAMLKQLGSGSQFGTPKLQNIALNRLLHDATTICAAAAQHAGIRLELAPSADVKLEADPSQIVRVITNLIKNALRASPAGSRIHLNSQCQDHGVLIRISDQGCGIPPEHLPHIFEPGYTSKGEGQGGLGLAISYLMIDAHGGHLELIPNPQGPGTQARIWLPLPSPPPEFTDDPFADIPIGSRILLYDPSLNQPPHDDPHSPESPHAALITHLETTRRCEVAELHHLDELTAILHDDPHWHLILTPPGPALPPGLKLPIRPIPTSGFHD